MSKLEYFKATITQTNPLKVKVEENGKTQEITIDSNQNLTSQKQEANYKIGQNVVLVKSYAMQNQGSSQNTQYYIAGYDRTQPLFWLLVIFSLLSVAVARKHGFFAIIGLMYSFLVLFKVTLPVLLAGTNPVFAALLTAILISPVTFVLSHGLSSKTGIALVGTFISLFLTSIFSVAFIGALNLTGFGSEEAMFLQLQQGNIDIKGLLLCGIIIGTLGILDDITVSQASIVKELKEANVRLSSWELYTRAMRVGRDHISSAINTLVLVYTGASLPLLLLFVNSDVPNFSLISYDIIAEEIAKTLVSSIGLVLAVPITTLMAGIVYGNKKS